MNKFLGLILGTGLLVALSAAPASADIIYSVSGISAAGGGSLSGVFTTNDARTALVSANIVTPVQGAFTGFDYIYGLAGANSTVSAVLPSQYFRLDAPGEQLLLFFSAGLSASGGSLTSSYDFEAVAGSRTLTGNVTVAPAAPAAVPEPLSLSLLGAGLAGAALIRRRKAKA